MAITILFLAIGIFGYSHFEQTEWAVDEVSRISKSNFPLTTKCNYVYCQTYGYFQTNSKDL